MNDGIAEMNRQDLALQACIAGTDQKVAMVVAGKTEMPEIEGMSLHRAISPEDLKKASDWIAHSQPNVSITAMEPALEDSRHATSYIKEIAQHEEIVTVVVHRTVSRNPEDSIL